MILSTFLAFAITLAMLFGLLHSRLAVIALDRPNHRSLHTQLTPRTGGIAIMTGVFSVWLSTGIPWLWIMPVLFLFAVSLVDDVWSLPVHWRLMAQLTASAAMVWILLQSQPWWLQFMAAFGITWMINLYNFMDGSDGLAGGMAMLGFGGYAVAAWMSGSIQIATMSAIVASAAAAFLIFNFYPARIFLGDGGSVPLGFLAGAIGLYGWKIEAWPAWFPMLIFSPFIMDASVVLLKRILSGERVWEAHRDHYYQKLVRMGWGHRKTALAEYGLMILTGASALALIDQSQSVVLWVFAGWAAAYLCLMRIIDRHWSSYLALHNQDAG